VEFWPIAALIPPRDAPPVLIGARVAVPKDWPASFYSVQGNSRCTSTMVGPRALFTAAHCVGNGATATLNHEGKSYVGRCTHAPEYAGNKTADWALCILDAEISPLPYETVNTNSGVLKEGADLLLTGFGCTRPDGTGGNDGVYRIGEATIRSLPSGTSNDIVVRGGAALCFGDSGGGAYIIAGGKRTLVSINSRGNIRDTSYLSSVSTSPARGFMERWAQENATAICGVTAAAPGCR
jgi:hypothetical protein